MSSVVDPHPEFPAEEELVAYLDGELAPDDCRRVEERLAADAAYRQQLRELDRAWEALESLPATRADDNFSRTTMEMVAIAAEGEASEHTRSARAAAQRRRWWLAAGGLAAVLAGFAAARIVQWRGDAALLADLPVIRQVDLLAHVESVDFLRRLPSGVPLNRLTTDDTAIRAKVLELARADAPEPADRREWIEALSRDEQAELAAQANRFRALSVHERDRLRRLYDEMRSAADAEQLRSNLLAYGQWLAQLSLGEQEDLKESLHGRSVDEQVEQIQRFVRQEARRDSRRLSPDDAEKLRRAVLALVEERRTAVSDELRRRGAGDRARRLQEPGGALMVLYWSLQNEQLANEVRERVVRELSPEARDHLEKLGRDGRRMQLWQWVRDSLRPKWGAGELEEFFVKELDNDQRARLLNLPPGEMQAELERLYVASELGFRGMGEPGDGLWNPPGPGRREFRPESGGRPGGTPREFRDRERFERGPGGPPGPRPGDRIPGDRNGRRPPLGPPGPPPPDKQREAI